MPGFILPKIATEATDERRKLITSIFNFIR